MNCRHFSLEHLIRLAFSYGLLTDYRMTPFQVVLLKGTEVLLEADPEETRLFLQGLVTGHVAAREAASASESSGTYPPPRAITA